MQTSEGNEYFFFVLFCHVNGHWPQRQWWKPGVLPGRARTAVCNRRAPRSEEGLGSPCTWKTSTAREVATSALLPSQRQNQNSPSLDHYIFCTKNELSSNCAGLLLASKAGPVLWKRPDHLHFPHFSSCKWTYFQLKPSSKMHSRHANENQVQRTQTCLKKTPEANTQDSGCFEPTASPLAAHVPSRQLLRTRRKVECSALLRDTLFPLQRHFNPLNLPSFISLIVLPKSI